jgi:hypothetical protein
MTSKEIRKAFLDFFASKGHQIVPSAPMVVKNDPTLMFTNAGMNQFKDWFLGNSPAKWKRVADSQKYRTAIPRLTANIATVLRARDLLERLFSSYESVLGLNIYFLPFAISAQS